MKHYVECCLDCYIASWGSVGIDFFKKNEIVHPDRKNKTTQRSHDRDIA